MKELSHIDSKGEARMVDISQKNDTVREAVVTGGIRMKPATLVKIKQNEIKKGDVLSVARVAAIMAAKKTPDLIPLCHPIMIDNIAIDFNFVGDDFIKITATAKRSGKTGVEMEALVAASVAALTIYDMCKAVDKGMTIEQVCLESKRGGKSGTYIRDKE
ncbi:MAG: cyclic pyranopterin monophosphate synthase MoaC [Dehalococcoidales bacterium]|nr:cyclic pyranopterin monophosphate synthase MoaC [Dehalococcoidales bacterium]